MAMSDEERRKRERERKARQRAKKRAEEQENQIPAIGLAAAGASGTDGGTPDLPEWAAVSMVEEAVEVLEALTIPQLARPLVPMLLRLARDIDNPLNVPQRSGLTDRYLQVLDRILAAAKPVVRDPLDDMRRAYYRGEVPDGSIDPDEDDELEERKRKA